MRLFGRRKPEPEERADIGHEAGQAFLAQIQRGTSDDPAAVDSAAAIWSGALAGCKVTGDYADAVTPRVLAAVGDGLVRRGAYLARIVVDTEGPLFFEAWTWTWQGTQRRPTVRVTESALSQVSVSRVVGFDDVIWLRWRDEPQHPWAGVPPIVGNAREWAAQGERALGDELGGDIAKLLPTPRAENPDKDAERKRHGETAESLRQSRGRTVLVPSTTAHWGDDNKPPASSEWQPRRLGPDVPDGNVNATKLGYFTALEMCGIPRGMVDGGAAQTAREALRRFAIVSLAPLADRIALEFRSKLGGELTIEPDPAVYDLQGRAGAFRAFVSADDVDAAEAKRLAGIEEPDGDGGGGDDGD
ncbi:hypothetical protein [Candidatus Poriferisodalis sp.]|uniref:hypothetical protein n=1 Tax=Candidatus Poriferisodalis sp. TaxID=3101277 RepID=UPI003B015CC9